MKNVIIIIVAFILSFFKIDAAQSGKIFMHTDANGVVSMTDDIDKMPSSYKEKEKEKTAVIVKRNQIYVPVTIGYQGRSVNVYLILDTGATGVTISPAIARRLGIKTENTRQGFSIIADGSKVVTHIATADFVSVGPKIKRAIDILILPHASGLETGLLGMNFLGEFPHMINMKAQVINWM
ncbi:MAG: retropepsin-like aspartic protease [Desulfuromonadaceae bacterium]|nr:retropepsin-like aspartic protease [Desulfuromonadaceae bacterium]